MHSDAITIYCPNPLCQSPNPESHKFCFQCRTPLPKRYLWLVGKGLESLRPGELLADRYWLKRDRIVLDTKPGLAPDSAEEIPETIEPYLRLSPFQPHVPQVYGLIKLRYGFSVTTVLLLEQAPIYPEGISANRSSESLEGYLMPDLASVWQESSALRQLNWLWQIAQLWQPFSVQNVASTLLQPELLRVEGGFVRILELQPDTRKAPSFADLGQLWMNWQATAQPLIADFLTKLCEQMQRGQIRSAEQIVAVFDQALAVCGQTQSRQIKIATQTDQGPSRQRNEDACYPPSGSVLTIAPPTQGGASFSKQTSRGVSLSSEAAPLVVVCDGIGGHEGGEIASSLAITVVQQKLQRHLSSLIDPDALVSQLEQAVLAANDVISQRNDSESRQERQRMGTTLVMTLVHDHELYLVHVGDSRAYRITRNGCHQVTLDDDLASRETRLGYATYREALQQQGSGSLVQALGMGPSSLLHPTMQRFILDEDCLFLLCSDGLSDNDRVEEHWPTELLPVLEGKVDIGRAVQRLVAIANSQNGHDNVTIGLIHCRVSPGDRFSSSSKPLDVALATPPTVSNSILNAASSAESAYSTPQTSRTKILRRSTPNPIPRLLGMGVLLAMVGVITYVLMSNLRSRVNAPVSSVESPSPQPTTSVSVSPSPPSPQPSVSLRAGNLILITRLTPEGETEANPIALRSQPPGATPTPGTAVFDVIPVGTVLQVLSRQEISGKGNWLQLKVCSTSATRNPATPTVQAGQIGWIQEDAIAPLVSQEAAPTAVRLGKCTNTTPSTETKRTPG